MKYVSKVKHVSNAEKNKVTRAIAESLGFYPRLIDETQVANAKNNLVAAYSVVTKEKAAIALFKAGGHAYLYTALREYGGDSGKDIRIAIIRAALKQKVVPFTNMIKERFLDNKEDDLVRANAAYFLFKMSNSLDFGLIRIGNSIGRATKYTNEGKHDLVRAKIGSLKTLCYKFKRRATKLKLFGLVSKTPNSESGKGL